MTDSRALLLMNLGTPANLSGDTVGAYLAEFLMDPAVVDVPWPLRWLLVHGLIVPSRKQRSAAAYKKIWTSRGSPLLCHSLDFLEELRSAVPRRNIQLAMRYGEPSLGRALREVGVGTPLDFAPLYPQHAPSSTGTAVQYVRRTLQQEKPRTVRLLKPFYNRPEFIRATAALFQEAVADFDFDFVLFSYHGLPKRQAKLHYEKHCHATTAALAKTLHLPADKVMTSFQSRLGPGWVHPFTDHMFQSLPRRGVRRLVVLCPSFVADCLETLEEIALRGRDLFTASGGAELRLVPALNASPQWVSGFQSILSDDSAWEVLES